MSDSDEKQHLLAQIEALRQEMRDLRKSKYMLRAIMDNAPVLISTKDLSGKFLMANRRYEFVNGRPPSALIGKTLYEVFPFDVADELRNNDIAALEAGHPIEVEETVQHKDLSTHTYFSVKFPLLNDTHQAFGICSISVDITERKQAQERSIRDELTGLYNRRHFNVVFKEQLQRSRREQRNFVFLILDLDYFKKYNDTYGHQKGDEVLASVGGVLTRTLKRYGDFSFRIGGEEFGCIFFVREPEHARTLADRIRQAVEQLNIEHQGNPVSRRVTLSAGVVVVSPDDQHSTDEIFNLADEALYKAKSEGRNRIWLCETADA